MTMLTPDDPGSGRLFFWTRQGISLQQLYDVIQQAIDNGSITATPPPAGGTIDGQVDPINIIGSTDVGRAVLTASGASYGDRQASARLAIDAPPTAHTHPASPVDVANLTGESVVGGQLLVAATPAAALALLNGIDATAGVTPAQLPAGTVMLANGATTPRPTSRTDIPTLWTASSQPTNGISGDVWLNGPDS